MKRYIFALLAFLSAFAGAANVQLKDLPAATSAVNTDIVGLQIDVSGTMRDRKMTLGNLALNLDPQLTAIANSSPSANQLWLWGSATSGSFLTLSSNTQSFLGAADYGAMRLQLSLVPGIDYAGENKNTRNLQGFTLQKTISTIPSTSTGISGATYNPRSNTLFLIRNVTGLAGTTYETTLDGVVLRTITNANFIDTESIEYITSIKAGSGQVYDVFAIGEEDHTTAANESQISLVLLTPTATSLDRTATNGADPDNVTTTTAYSGGTMANLGLESIAYDSKRGVIYYTAEKQTSAGSDNTAGTGNAKVFQRSVTATASTLAFGAESTLCNINFLFTGGTLTDISDATYDPASDTLLLQSDESDLVVRLSIAPTAGVAIETFSDPGNQPEGVAISPNGKQLFVVGEPQEFYRYEIGNAAGLSITNTSAYGAGTAYSLTATSAAVDFGTTDPAITIPAPGTYEITGQVLLNYNGATFAANQNVTLKFRRTNNTAADLSNGTITTVTGVVTTTTSTFAVVRLPDVVYSTINSNDALTIFADVAVVPSAGSLQAVSVGSFIRAKKLY